MYPVKFLEIGEGVGSLYNLLVSGGLERVKIPDRESILYG